MRMLSVAVAVMLAFICLQENSAAPVTELEEPMAQGFPPAVNPDMPIDSLKLQIYNRQKRETSAMECKGCCNTNPDGSISCGICCSF
ncbi:hepcidin-like [Notolabrus celidotus]|uniref:hepcidin-like n=1 Tax=Notolabrus celidotus TaxID=1203425 RepID=UPI00148FFD0B|nr:hepcidin-like [Notolabrus celidotus]